jgi:hypothetical protein
MASGGEGRIAKRITRLEQENERLRTENAALREEFKQVRSLQKRMLDALDTRPSVEVQKRRGGLIRTVLIAGGACVVGMRLGRERYEQMLTAARERAGAAKERLGGSQGQQVVTMPDVSAPEGEIAPEHEPSPASRSSTRTDQGGGTRR